jgi:hypothetical protein
MGIPDEDLGPKWLRDYGDVDVQVATLLQFGKSLMDELQKDYIPHVKLVFEDMSAADSVTTPDFVELVDALGRHQTVRVETTTRLAKHADGMYAFAQIAETISKNYDEADAFAAAKAKDVNPLLVASPTVDNGPQSPNGTPALPTETTNSGSTTTTTGSPYVAPNPDL